MGTKPDNMCTYIISTKKVLDTCGNDNKRQKTSGMVYMFSCCSLLHTCFNLHKKSGLFYILNSTIVNEGIYETTTMVVIETQIKHADVNNTD